MVGNVTHTHHASHTHNSSNWQTHTQAYTQITLYCTCTLTQMHSFTPKSNSVTHIHTQWPSSDPLTVQKLAALSLALADSVYLLVSVWVYACVCLLQYLQLSLCRLQGTFCKTRCIPALPYVSSFPAPRLIMCDDCLMGHVKTIYRCNQYCLILLCVLLDCYYFKRKHLEKSSLVQFHQHIVCFLVKVGIWLFDKNNQSNWTELWRSVSCLLYNSVD